MQAKLKRMLRAIDRLAFMRGASYYDKSTRQEERYHRLGRAGTRLQLRVESMLGERK